jgi:transposase
MNASLFWFSDEQWSRIEPHLPTNQPGPERKNDRRILSDHACAAGWVPMEGLSERVWTAQDDLQPFRAVERTGYLAEDVRCGCGRSRCSWAGGARQQPCEDSSLRQWR